MNKKDSVKVVKFQKKIWDFYHEHKRSNLPWRKSITPYKVYVSEIMLQQTQVDRVIPFFRNWMKLFPTLKKLSDAPQSEVLRAWKGLGYNSRALRMKKVAELSVLKGLPKTYDELVKLPGIGPYTAGAICAFAYNQPVVMIETNIRRVFIHEFFQHSLPAIAEVPPLKEGVGSVHDRDIIKLVESSLDKNNPREWYWALMDYGSYLGKTIPNPNKKSRHYTKQSKFKGSDREIRGKVLGILLENKMMVLENLLDKIKNLSKHQERVEMIIQQMETEGFLEIDNEHIQLK